MSRAELAILVVALIVAIGALVVAVVAARRELAAEQRSRPQVPGVGTRDRDAGLPAVHPTLHVQPIVLVHGVLGFDHLAVLGQKIVYFRGVADVLRDSGAVVHTARLPPLASVPDRARALAEFVRELPYPRVNLIAHSMGGLDARYAIARFGLADRVASLTTIATPHRGTPLADLIAQMAGYWPMRALRDLVGQAGVTTEAVDWLTTRRAGELNRRIDDAAGVLYGSVVGRAHRPAIRKNPVLYSGHLYIASRGGDNDGMVPVTSQEWGQRIVDIDADHWAQIGWSSYFDAAPVYLQLVAYLRRHGV